MERQGFGTRRWEIEITGSRFGIGDWRFWTLLGLAIVIMGSATASAAASGSGGEPELGITVRVDDYAKVWRGTLIAAEKQAASIFRQAGLTMRWCNVLTDSAERQMDSSCVQPAGRAVLTLRIVPGLKVVPGVTTDSTMGFAVGSLATVSYRWIEDAETSGVAKPWEILACVIAHEIGHLLLGPNSHSRTGIMVGKWGPQELQDTRWGRLHLLFTPRQAEALRAEVQARSGEWQASTTQTSALEPFSATSITPPSRRNSTARRDPATRSADLKMSVRVYNYAGSPADTLRFAEGEAEKIFARAGVYLDWHECPITARTETADSAFAAPLTSSDLELRIVGRVKLVRIQASAEATGFTIGNLATLQLEPLQELVTPTEYVRNQMLGRAIAHEFGHALLGAGHSSHGIMQARWGGVQLDPAAANDLVFTPDQERALRLAVKTRNKR